MSVFCGDRVGVGGSVIEQSWDIQTIAFLLPVGHMAPVGAPMPLMSRTIPFAQVHPTYWKSTQIPRRSLSSTQIV